jgi:Protein of unknown function, DUF547
MKIFRFLIILLAFSSLQSCIKVRDYNSDSKPINHAIFDSLLKKYVNDDGYVNYKGFLKDSVQFNSYLDLLSRNHPNEKNWGKEERLAYWINAYNAFTIKLICNNYPLKSIKDIKSGIPFVSDTWTISFIKIEGKTYNLNDIEHGIIRPKFNDPRIHFAVNCASKGCPPLRKEAFMASKLDAQLDEQAKNFINDGNRNKIQSANKAELSKIFTWFAGDFKKAAPSVIAFINKYSNTKLSEKATLDYQDYDWNLNEQPQ